MDDIEAALQRIRQYRDLRGRVEDLTPGIHDDIRLVKAAGATKAKIKRESGLSRPWIDKILGEGGDVPTPRANDNAKEEQRIGS